VALLSHSVLLAAALAGPLGARLDENAISVIDAPRPAVILPESPS
jgi:hypothetical protein